MNHKKIEDKVKCLCSFDNINAGWNLLVYDTDREIYNEELLNLKQEYPEVIDYLHLKYENVVINYYIPDEYLCVEWDTYYDDFLKEHDLIETEDNVEEIHRLYVKELESTGGLYHLKSILNGNISQIFIDPTLLQFIDPKQTGVIDILDDLINIEYPKRFEYYLLFLPEIIVTDKYIINILQNNIDFYRANAYYINKYTALLNIFPHIRNSKDIYYYFLNNFDNRDVRKYIFGNDFNPNVYKNPFRVGVSREDEIKQLPIKWHNKHVFKYLFNNE